MSSTAVRSSSDSRLVSLDALRGFDMFWIIGGSHIANAAVKAVDSPSLVWIPAQLQHVPWEGFHFIDLIFPLFLFLIGVSIPYSLSKRLARGDRPRSIYAHLLKRVAILIVLGMMVNGKLLTCDPSQFQITYSVLQMLALGYLVAAILFLHFGLTGQIVAVVVMLLGYWALLAFVPGPGHEIGVFKPGGNLGDWLNDWLLGDLQRRWRLGWILGILGHASTAMLGVWAGLVLRSSHTAARKTIWLTCLGGFCLVTGLIWSGWIADYFPGLTILSRSWSEWPVWCPIVKNRWTSSYALYSGGMSYLLLAVFYLVVDAKGYRRWALPFRVIGANSIFAYMAWSLGSSVFRQASLVFLGGLESYVGPWHDTIVWTGAFGILWLLLYYFYRNGTFLRA